MIPPLAFIYRFYLAILLMPSDLPRFRRRLEFAATSFWQAYLSRIPICTAHFSRLSLNPPYRNPPLVIDFCGHLKANFRG